MIFDGIIFILVAIAFIRGWKKGILWAVFSLVAVVIGILLSLKLSHTVANYLFEKHILQSQYTLLLSFILIFIAIVFAFRTSIKLVEKLLDKILLGWVNKLVGGILYAFIIVFLSSTILWLCNQVNILGPSVKKDSKTYPYIENLAPKTISFCSDYLPLVKNVFQEIKSLTEKVVK